MTDDKQKDTTAAQGDGDDRSVYKPTKRDVANATRNMTDLMVGLSEAVAEGARAFGKAVRRDGDQVPGPTDVAEASAISASKVFESLASVWKEFYDNLQRDHAEREQAAPAAAAPEIDYDRLADLVVAKLEAKKSKK